MRTLLAALVLLAACHKTPPELHPERGLCDADLAQACKAPSGVCADSLGYACARCVWSGGALPDGCFLDGVNDGAGAALSTVELGLASWWACYADCSSCAPPRAGETCAPDTSP